MGTRVVVTRNEWGKLAATFPEEASLAVEATAQAVAKDAAAGSPDVLGISGEWTVDHRQGPFRRTVSNREWRAVFYEDGTPYVPGRHMLRAACERGGRRLLEALRGALR